MNLFRDICAAASAACISSLDCRLKIREGETTTIGWGGPEYDGNGDRVDDGDPNWAHHAVTCRRCGGEWNVTSKNERVVSVAQSVKR